jgi:ribose/xylose/arabinose/galactoside ABC-type transport system permease subunit
LTTGTVTITLPRRGVVLATMQRWGVYVAIGLLLIYDLIFTSGFVDVDNLRTQLVQVVPVLIVALGMSLVIGTEGIDLSVGGVMAMSAAVLPLYIGYGFLPAVVVAIVVGTLVGVVNGSLVAFVGVQPIVATLALMVAGRGLALLIAHEQLVPVLDPGVLTLGRDSLFGVLPYSVLVAAVLVVLVAVLVGRTTFGKQLVAIGGNRRASELSGLTARLGASVPSTLGNLIELSAITAVVVGGTPLSGGLVKIGGTVAGALLLQLLRATLIAHNVSDWYSQIIQAVIIVAAVYIQRGRVLTR